MRLLDYLLGRSQNDRQMTALVRELSDAALSDVWDRVRGQVFGMDLLEARGYVRARAMAPVRNRSATLLANRSDLNVTVQQQVVNFATNRVVQRILCDLASGSTAKRRAA
ncbi:MAG: hypothetical protein K8T25_12835 [Planctomycetia bacterium]|nr:hypothetical protein [Planctomycetia bacterium]